MDMAAARSVEACNAAALRPLPGEANAFEVRFWGVRDTLTVPGRAGAIDDRLRRTASVGSISGHSDDAAKLGIVLDPVPGDAIPQGALDFSQRIHKVALEAEAPHRLLDADGVVIGVDRGAVPQRHARVGRTRALELVERRAGVRAELLHRLALSVAMTGFEGSILRCCAASGKPARARTSPVTRARPRDPCQA